MKGGVQCESSADAHGHAMSTHMECKGQCRCNAGVQFSLTCPGRKLDTADGKASPASMVGVLVKKTKEKTKSMFVNTSQSFDYSMPMPSD